MVEPEEDRLTDFMERHRLREQNYAQIKASKFLDLVTNFNEHVTLELPNNTPESWADDVSTDEEEGEEERPRERAGRLVPVKPMFATSECSLTVYVRDARLLIDQVTKMSNTVPEITSTGTETIIKATILHEEVSNWMENLKHHENQQLKETFEVFVPPRTAKNSLSAILGVRLNLTIDTQRPTAELPTAARTQKITPEEITYRHVRNVTRRAPDPDHIKLIRSLKKGGGNTIEILKNVFGIKKIPGVDEPTIDDIILHEMHAMW